MKDNRLPFFSSINLQLNPRITSFLNNIENEKINGNNVIYDGKEIKTAGKFKDWCISVAKFMINHFNFIVPKAIAKKVSLYDQQQELAFEAFDKLHFVDTKGDNKKLFGGTGNNKGRKITVKQIKEVINKLSDHRQGNTIRLECYDNQSNIPVLNQKTSSGQMVVLKEAQPLANDENSAIDNSKTTNIVASESSMSIDIDNYDKSVDPATPRIIFIVGGAGSGKSTLANKLIEKNKNKRKYNLVDTDEIRDNLPEYKNFLKEGKKTSTHPEEFSRIHGKARLLKDKKLNKYLNNKSNIIYPTPGGSFLQSMIDKFKKNGFYVKLFFVDANKDAVLQRVAKREEDTGRHTPNEFIDSSRSVSESYFHKNWSQQVHTSRHYNNDEFFKLKTKKKNKWGGLKTHPKR